MALSSDDTKRLRNQCESWGEPKVRELLTARRFGEGDAPERLFVEDWLREKEALRDSESVTVARQANSIARKARSEARAANIIAISAIVLSIIMAIIQWASLP